MAAALAPQISVEMDLLPVVDHDEMVDFTCVTPWERLALDIELKLREWSLAGGRAESQNANRTDDVTLGRRGFRLRYLAEIDPNMERILGVKQCVLLEPRNAFSVAAGDASDASTLLSALTVASTACGCGLPLIVRVGNADALRFIGRQCSGLSQFRFSCDYLGYLPPAHSNLPGLLQLFHNKRVVARRLQPPSRTDAVVSAEFTYFWSDFSFEIAVPHDSFATEPLLKAFHGPLLLGGDPISYLEVSAIWLPFQVSTLSSSGGIRDMPFTTASSFRIRPPQQYSPLGGTISSGVSLPLTSPVRNSLKLAEAADRMPGPAARHSVVSVPMSVDRDSETPSESLESPSRSTLTTSRREGDVDTPPPPDNLAAHDSHVDAPVAILSKFLHLASREIGTAAIADQGFDPDFLISGLTCLFNLDTSHGLDADVVDALGPSAMRLTTVQRLGRLVAGCRTLSAARLLWRLFLDCVELHWQRKWVIPNIPHSLESGPDQSDALLVQKLQMMNCCVGRISQVRKKEVDLRGRRLRIPSMTLLGNQSAQDTNAFPNAEHLRHVYEPMVQPLPYVTRDIVEAEESKIIKNATAEGDKQNEARRQSSTLRSDMMSFKAANPGSCMADFVRWFSPSDWLSGGEDSEDGEDLHGASADECGRSEGHEGSSEVQGTALFDDTKGSDQPSRQRENGRLSARMCAPGNLWQEVWDAAEAVAAARQTPLFDPSLHGFKALDDLRLLPMSEVLRQLACVQAMYGVNVLQNAFSTPPDISSVVSAITAARHSVHQSQNVSSHGVEALAITSEACDRLASAEVMALGAASLLRKLPPSNVFGSALNALVSGNETVISGSKAGSALALVAGIDDEGWRSPITPSYRSYVLEGSNMDRMYALLASDEFRVGVRLALDYTI
jgi:hypothetical protein